MPSHLKDTTYFLRKLDAVKSVPDNTYLVSLDVKSLYTSLSNGKERNTIKVSFDKHTSKTVVTKVITTFLALILTLKNLFNCVQLQALSSNKRLCHGYDMHTILCKYFHGSL